MKTKLLKRLRKQGRESITIYSVTTENGITIGMLIGHNGGAYRELFNFGDTEKDVYKKATKIYINEYIKNEREKQIRRHK